MLQLYITATKDVGFYFLYDPVKDNIYEGSFISYEAQCTQETLQTHALHDAFVQFADTKALSRYEQSRTDILKHAPVKIYIQDSHVHEQFKAPWKYDGLWKAIAQKRRQLKYFEFQDTYHMTDLPMATQVIFETHLTNIQLYRDAQYEEQFENNGVSAVDMI